MAKLGLPVVYHAHDGHKLPHPTEEGATHGSVHHPDHHEFAALITRVLETGHVDLVIFPPNRMSIAVDNVPHLTAARLHGSVGHSWRHIDHHDDERDRG